MLSQIIPTVYFQKFTNISSYVKNSTRMRPNLPSPWRLTGTHHSQVLLMVSQYALNVLIIVHKK